MIRTHLYSLVIAVTLCTVNACAGTIIAADSTWAAFTAYTSGLPPVVFNLDLTSASSAQEIKIVDGLLSGDTYKVDVSNGAQNAEYFTSSVSNYFPDEYSQLDKLPYNDDSDIPALALDAWADSQSASPHFSAVQFLLNPGTSYTITITRLQMASFSLSTYSDVSADGFISAGAPDPTPEAGTLAMLGLGIGAFVVAPRRRS